MSDSLQAFKDDNYQLGNCRVLAYDRKRIDIFGNNGYLTKLYRSVLESGTLKHTFCGMLDLSCDTISAYLSTRDVILLTVQTGNEEFVEAGFTFPVTFCGIKPERSAFCAYTFAKQWWGKPEIRTLGWLGLAYLFNEFELKAIHGMRYPTNSLTKRFMEQYGFSDTGYIPRYMLRDGELVAGVVSTLMREDFEENADKWLLSLATSTL